VYVDAVPAEVTSSFAVGAVVPIPTFPLSNIDPVATVEADENLTT
jgi:hypothetical protein